MAKSDRTNLRITWRDILLNEEMRHRTSLETLKSYTYRPNEDEQTAVAGTGTLSGQQQSCKASIDRISSKWKKKV